MGLLRIPKVVVACWLLGRLTTRGISWHLPAPDRGRKSTPHKRRNPWFYQGLNIVRHRLASSVISEGDGTRTRNHRIDSVVRRVAASPCHLAPYDVNSLDSPLLRPPRVLHRVATVLYEVVQHGGTYEAPDSSRTPRARIR